MDDGRLSWDAVAHAVLSVNPLWLPGLALVWWAGHCARAFVMMISLPGLTLRRALALCVAGSAVSNGVPLGGALSYGVTTAMARSWGFTATRLTDSFAINQICNVLARLLFGALALGWLLTLGPGGVASTSAVVVSSVTAVLVLVCGAVLASDWVAGWIWPGGSVVTVRRIVTTGLQKSWVWLGLGTAAYMLLLAALLELCLYVLGAPLPFLVVLAVVGIERLITVVPLTPGGAGAAELALFAGLTAAGTAGADALAAALLYRFFTFLAEIPVGTVVIIGWRIRMRMLSG
jgi:uncharacterized membrane protein YbhN (UPF0104 family)